MSNEKDAGGSDGGGKNPQPDPSTAVTTGTGSADRFGITNIGFELKESGELAMRLGTVANAYRGDHLAAQLLRIREWLIGLHPLIDTTCEFLQEQARVALNSSFGDRAP